MKLYLIRHGETDMNRLLGHVADSPLHTKAPAFKLGDDTNVPLNEIGKIQAAAITAQLPEHFDIFYASPLLRTKETAEIIAQAKGVNLSEIIYRNDLVEYHLGSLESTTREQRLERFGDTMGSGLLCDYDFSPWGGDSWKTIYKRVDGFLNGMKNLDNEKVVIAVTSAGVIRMSYKVLFNDRAPGIAGHLRLPNGSVHEFVL